jgi:hypothetical protein
MTSEKVFPRLKIARKDAFERINLRLRIGKKLLRADLNSRKDLDIAIEKATNWHEYNSDMLMAIFENDYFYQQYSGPAFTINLLQQTVPEYIYLRDFRTHLRILESIRDRIELVQEPSESQRIVDTIQIIRSSLFIAMSMNPDDLELHSVNTTIKLVARECGLNPIRIDDEVTTKPITPRVLKQLRIAEYIVADLTYGRNSVYYEAGYSEALGSTPIYLARNGTEIAFDLKDYPVEFYKDTMELQEKLTRKLKALIEQSENKLEG